MNELNTGFSQYSHLNFFEKASLIHTNLTKAPGITYFPITDPTMLTIQTGLIAFQTSLSGTNSSLRDTTRAALTNLLQQLAPNLEKTANGNMAMLSETGFDLRKSPVHSTMPPTIPGNLRVKSTGIAGQVQAKCAASDGADAYVLEYTLDPMAGPWTEIDPVTNSQNILISGLTRGKDYYFRVRGIGANGTSGWSDVATMMVV